MPTPRISAQTSHHPLPHGELCLLGACSCVTGAMTRIDLGAAKLLVDAGAPQGDDARGWSLPDAALEVDGIVLTHGHQDHVGALAAMLEAGFSGPIYATAATFDIATMIVEDGLGLEGASTREIREFRTRLAALARPVRHDVPFQANGLTVTMREAGHILGSASVEVESNDARVLVSGDLGRPDSPLLRDYQTSWSAHRPFDLVVMESTYGDRNHRHGGKEVEDELERVVKRALRDGGHILVPAFAIGRTQTLLYHLDRLQTSGRIPKVPVALDSPLGLRVTEVYGEHTRLFDREALDRIGRGDDPLDFADLYAVRRGGDSVRLRDVKDPMIIIAGSGMCTGGRIVGHLQELLPRPETCVVFVGYQAVGTPGRAIQEAGKRRGSVRLGGEQVDVRAEITSIGGLSAHADQSELTRWVRAIPDVRAVALHHGEPEAQEALVAHLQRAWGGA